MGYIIIIIIISIISCTLPMPVGEWSHDWQRTRTGEEDFATGHLFPPLSETPN